MLLLSCSDDTERVNNPQCNVGNVEDFLLTNGAFRFTGQTGNSSVTFHVTAVVCLDDGLTSQCETECANCGSRRKRRESVQESLETKYYLTAGPYKFTNAGEVQTGLYLCWYGLWWFFHVIASLLCLTYLYITHTTTTTATTTTTIDDDDDDHHHHHHHHHQHHNYHQRRRLRDHHIKSIICIFIFIRFRCYSSWRLNSFHSFGHHSGGQRSRVHGYGLNCPG